MVCTNISKNSITGWWGEGEHFERFIDFKVKCMYFYFIGIIFFWKEDLSILYIEKFLIEIIILSKENCEKNVRKMFLTKSFFVIFLKFFKIQ